MSKSATDRAVRKALLQAHAEVERIELARRLSDVRQAATPRALLQQYVPISSLLGGSSSGSSGQSVMSRIGSQLTEVYRRYPLVLSSAASLLARRRRSRLARLLRLVSFALTVQKALGGPGARPNRSR